ncbi:MAG: LuxR family transcriptional regulator, partial [Chloroflexota bacterium]
MSLPLLSTKFHIPRSRAAGVSRPRLTKKLRAGMHHPGTFALLSGPAGFGKTTLLTEFIAEYRQPVAWLSLDAADNDPIRFWTYLIHACQVVEPRLGEAAL